MLANQNQPHNGIIDRSSHEQMFDFQKPIRILMQRKSTNEMQNKISHVDRTDEITFAPAVAFFDFVFITVVKCVYTSRHSVTFTRGSLNVRDR
jgi:hypothetical protein